MGNSLAALLITFCLLLLAGCQQTPKIDRLIQEQLSLLTEYDIIKINQTNCEKQDQYEVMVSKKHPLQLKVNQLVKDFPTVVNNQELDYRIYLNTVATAWSSLNGCVRINSGLISMLDDNEIQAVIAHEIGHIALNHSIMAFRSAKFAEVDNSTGLVTLINKQSLIQQQEFEADSYAMSFLKKHQINPNGLITMLSKLDSIQKKENTAYPSISLRKSKL